MRFEYNDGGRVAAGFKGEAGDCVTRSVAIATGLPYMEVYEALSEGQRTQRLTKRTKARASARNGVSVRRKWFKDYMTAFGWKWTPTMGIGTGCTVHLTDGELPMGRLIVAVSKHYTAVIDGVIHDTYDPQREVHWLKTVDGVQSSGVSKRCVYGYWSKA